ncbi:MAG: YicC family protein [Ruminococcus sp.]|nr:YicC family protein [Ruminococcus sp.]
MTGYGRCQSVIGGYDILLEIRSVNHRFFDFTAKIPRSYGYLEEKLKSFFQGSISRGKVEVSLSIYSVGVADAVIEVNESVAEGYVNALREANKKLMLNDDLSLSNLMRLPDVFNIRKAADDEEVVWECVRSAAQTALDDFIAMRENEGRRMVADVCEKLDNIEKMVAMVEAESPKITEAYRTRLTERMKEILGNTSVDEQRIISEAAIFSEKTAVDEETVRLKSHISQCREMLSGDNAIGRKLDFLIQEFNREANTIGSKCQGLEITKTVIEMKSEIEKIREQIQNIE